MPVTNENDAKSVLQGSVGVAQAEEVVPQKIDKSRNSFNSTTVGALELVRVDRHGVEAGAANFGGKTKALPEATDTRELELNGLDIESKVSISSLCTHPDLRLLLLMLLFTVSFTTAEMLGAVMANSISMAADSGTMVVDSVTYVVNLVTEYRKLSGKDSQWLEIYASAFSVITLFAVTAASLYDAVFRLCCVANNELVDAQMMFWFTIIGLAIDIIMCFMYYARPAPKSRTDSSISNDVECEMLMGHNTLSNTNRSVTHGISSNDDHMATQANKFENEKMEKNVSSEKFNNSRVKQANAFDETELSVNGDMSKVSKKWNDKAEPASLQNGTLQNSVKEYKCNYDGAKRRNSDIEANTFGNGIECGGVRTSRALSEITKSAVYDATHITTSVCEHGFDCDGRKNVTGNLDTECECNESISGTGNLNMDSAFVHLLADTLRSVTVLVSSVMVWGLGTDSMQSDAVSSIVVSVLVFGAGLFVAVEVWHVWKNATNAHAYARVEN